MRRLLSILTIVLLATVTAAAQTEGDLKRHFEGRRVTLKMDVPATKGGVNVYAEGDGRLDHSDHAAGLRRRGASIRRGETVMVTRVSVRGRRVEFQLGGGESRLSRAIAGEAEESRRARVEEKALRTGGRFNVHLAVSGSGVPTPAAIEETLRKYVDFSEAAGEDDGASLQTTPPDPRIVSVGPRTTFLKQGLSEDEVVRLLGSPSLILRAAGGRPSATYEFQRGEGRVLVAEFEDGVLVSSRTEARDKAVGAARFR